MTIQSGILHTHLDWLHVLQHSIGSCPFVASSSKEDCHLWVHTNLCSHLRLCKVFLHQGKRRCAIWHNPGKRRKTRYIYSYKCCRVTSDMKAWVMKICQILAYREIRESSLVIITSLLVIKLRRPLLEFPVEKLLKSSRGNLTGLGGFWLNVYFVQSQ